MNFCHTTINVVDFEKSLEFYRDIIGLPVKRKFAVGSLEIAFLGYDIGTEVELIFDKNQKDFLYGKDISFGFSVDSIEDTIAMLKENNIDILGDVMKLNPQTRCFFVLDPNGIRIQFIGK